MEDDSKRKRPDKNLNVIWLENSKRKTCAQVFEDLVDAINITDSDITRQIAEVASASAWLQGPWRWKKSSAVIQGADRDDTIGKINAEFPSYRMDVGEIDVQASLGRGKPRCRTARDFATLRIFTMLADPKAGELDEPPTNDDCSYDAYYLESSSEKVFGGLLDCGTAIRIRVYRPPLENGTHGVITILDPEWIAEYLEPVKIYDCRRHFDKPPRNSPEYELVMDFLKSHRYFSNLIYYFRTNPDGELTMEVEGDNGCVYEYYSVTSKRAKFVNIPYSIQSERGELRKALENCGFSPEFAKAVTG